VSAEAFPQLADRERAALHPADGYLLRVAWGFAWRFALMSVAFAVPSLAPAWWWVVLFVVGGIVLGLHFRSWHMARVWRMLVLALAVAVTVTWPIHRYLLIAAVTVPALASLLAARKHARR
jgi:hypothetical protein